MPSKLDDLARFGHCRKVWPRCRIDIKILVFVFIIGMKDGRDELVGIGQIKACQLDVELVQGHQLVEQGC